MTDVFCEDTKKGEEFVGETLSHAYNPKNPDFQKICQRHQLMRVINFKKVNDSRSLSIEVTLYN